MKDNPFIMDADMRDLAMQTVKEVSEHRRWLLYAVHVKSNHVHVVIGSAETPEKMMSDIKARQTLLLREKFDGLARRRLWTQHGSTKYLWKQNNLVTAIAYVINGQGQPMSVYHNNQSRERK